MQSFTFGDPVVSVAPREIEIKMRITDLNIARQALQAAGAAHIETVHELNEFFDRPDASLRKAGNGLRIRSFRRDGAADAESLLTWKGPLAPGIMHNRPSIDLRASPASLAPAFLAALGYVRTAGFEKIRESWSLNACRIELDRLPHFGIFVEIEGPDEPTVLHVRSQLAMDGLEAISNSYHAMVAEYLRQFPVPDNTLRF